MFKKSQTAKNPSNGNALDAPRHEVAPCPATSCAQTRSPREGGRRSKPWFATLSTTLIAVWASGQFVASVVFAAEGFVSPFIMIGSGLVAAMAIVTITASLKTSRRSDGIDRLNNELALLVAKIEEGGSVENFDTSWGKSCPIIANFQSLAKMLRTRERYLHTIIESEPECVKTMSPEGSLIDMNPAGLNIIQADSLESVKGACVFDLVHEDHRQDFIDMHNRVIAGHSEVLVFRVVGLKGTVNWVETHACPMPTDDGTNFHVAITRCITQARERDEALTQLRERMDLAIAGSSNGLFDYDPISAECWFSNRFGELLGYEPGEIAPRFESWENFFHSEDRTNTINSIQAHLTDHVPFDVECRLRTKKGAFRWFRIKAQALWNDDNVATRMAGSISDIQSIKESVLEIAAAKELAEAANVAKSEFLANMSHEIRTPMTAILGFADVLISDAPTATERDAHLDTIRRNGEQLIAILNDILDLSKIESGRLEVERVEMDFVGCVEGVINLMSVRAEEKGIALNTEWVGRVPKAIQSDPVRLRQVLTNLIGNAIKFTKTGSVRVICGDEGCQPDQVAITVVDTGIGIDPSRIEKIFQPFIQADSSMSRNFGGTGLGLAICTSLASELDANLTVQSTLGQGSSFRLVISTPACALSLWMDAKRVQSASRVVPIEITRATGSLKGVRVLLAEDGVDNRRLICHLLEQAQAIVAFAQDGEEAMHAIAGAETPFDLVLMDMQMPRLNGYDATRQLRAIGVTTPIIALTAHAMVTDRERCLDAGCSDYLTKPIDRNTFISCCRRWSEHARAA